MPLSLFEHLPGQMCGVLPGLVKWGVCSSFFMNGASGADGSIDTCQAARERERKKGAVKF